MSQDEVYRLVERKPRLCIKEITELMQRRKVISASTVSTNVWNLVRQNDIIAAEPTREEVARLLKKYTGLGKCIRAGRIKMFIVSK